MSHLTTERRNSLSQKEQIDAKANRMLGGKEKRNQALAKALRGK